jgi:hypothetical protein
MTTTAHMHGSMPGRRCLVDSPPPSFGQHHLQEEGCGLEMLSSCGNVDNNNDNSANDDGWFRMNVPLLINKQHNASFRQTNAMKY